MIMLARDWLPMSMLMYQETGVAFGFGDVLVFLSADAGGGLLPFC